MLGSFEDIERILRRPEFWGTPSERLAERARVVVDFGSSADFAELRSRMSAVPQRERWLLYLWYVSRVPVTDIARVLGVSRVACYRVRRRALMRLIDPAKDADPSQLGAIANA